MADVLALANQEATTPPVRIAPVMGRTGLKHWAGYISEEFLPELRGLRAYRVFDEMRQNDPVVGGLLTGIESVICSAEWIAQPNDDTDGTDLAAADFINEAWERIDRPLDQIMSDVCTMFPFGWALLETTYKLEEGRVWWASIDLRGQDSLYIWDFDEQDRPVEFIQRPAPTYQELRIPLAKCLLFRTRTEKNNPEGKSILRTAYKPYYYKKVIEEIEAIGAERDLVGLPIMEVPFGATPAEVSFCQQIVERIKNDEQGGLVLTAIGPAPEQRFNLRILNGQGSGARTPYTSSLIQRYAAEIGMSALATFIHLGGSVARANQTYQLKDSRDLFQLAIKNWMGKITDVWNRDAIPRLLAMNGMTGKCKMTHGRITQLDLATITNFITAAVQNKVLTPDRTLEQFLRKESELPLLADSEKAASEEEDKAPPAGQPGANGPQTLPGQNQHGIFGPNAGAGQGGGVKTAPASTPGNPAAPPQAPVEPRTASEEWEPMTLKLLTELANDVGEFWSDD